MAISILKYYAGYLNKLNKLWATPFFLTRDVEIGANVRFGRNVIFNCQTVRIGKGCIFHDNTVIHADHFEIGDYGTIGADNFFPGPGTITMGHNCWTGKSCTIDGMGGTKIGNNVGVGGGSQLWSHVQFGDILAGCTFHGAQPLTIEDDVWICPQCLIAPVYMHQKTMLLMGTVLTKNTEANCVYAGNPAVDITHKTGPQFVSTSDETRRTMLGSMLDAFALQEKIHWSDYVYIADSEQDSNLPVDKTIFFLRNRTYKSTNTKLEYKLMRFLLPDAKFVPFQQA